MKYSTNEPFTKPQPGRPSASKKRLVVLIILALIASAAGYLLLSAPKKGEESPPVATTPSGEAVAPPASEEKPVEVARSPLTGLPVSEAAAGSQPIAVVIENHPSARPQSGLAAADMVYEVVAEGGITRLLVVFQSQQAPSIGPVRSVREYFADIAATWNAGLAHAGGAPSGYDRMRQLGVDDLDEFKNGAAYRRITSRRAPHNLYTSSNSLRRLMNRLGMETSPPDALVFEGSRGVPEGEPGVTTEANVAIDFSTSSYRANWSYRPKSGGWVRSTGGLPASDALSGKRVTARNVVIIKTSINVVDSKLRVRVDLGSGGEALLFKGGRRYEARWERADGNGPITLVDGQGAPLPLSPGVTWYEIVGKGREVTYSPGS